jgi:hypothetical protein
VPPGGIGHAAGNGGVAFTVVAAHKAVFQCALSVQYFPAAAASARLSAIEARNTKSSTAFTTLYLS